MEVDAWSLREPADNPLRFTPFECPIGVELVFERPLPGDDIGVSWAGHKRPCAIALSGVRSRRAAQTDVGGGEGADVVVICTYLGLGMWIPACARVIIEWCCG